MNSHRSSLPKEVQKLITAFTSLPSIGPKTAQRLAYYVVNQDSDEVFNLSNALKSVKENLDYCKRCCFITSKEIEGPCNLCKDKNGSVICVVERVIDAITIEASEIHSGSFHILHGSICPINGIGPEKLRIKELMLRLEKEKTSELILATNPTLDGEATSMYLKKIISKSFKNIKITRLARGLASGTDLEYSDFSTLSNAFENRKPLD